MRKPFTATLNNVIADSKGIPKHSRVETISILEDGSSVEVREIVDSRPVGLRVVNDLTRRKKLVIDPLTESVTTYRLNSAEIDQAKQAFSCPGEPDRKLLDYSVVKRTIDTSVRPNQAVLREEEFIAPELGCYPLYKETTRLVNGVSSGTSETIVTSISIGEIDSAKLDVPAGYIERFTL